MINQDFRGRNCNVASLNVLLRCNQTASIWMTKEKQKARSSLETKGKQKPGWNCNTIPTFYYYYYYYYYYYLSRGKGRRMMWEKYPSVRVGEAGSGKHQNYVHTIMSEEAVLKSQKMYKHTTYTQTHQFSPPKKPFFRRRSSSYFKYHAFIVFALGVRKAICWR